MKKLFLIIISFLLLSCSTFGQFSTQEAKIAHNAVDVAKWIIDAADAGLYASAMKLKEHSLIIGDEDLLRISVRVLSNLDSALILAKDIISGATVTNAELNIAAGQV